MPQSSCELVGKFVIYAKDNYIPIRLVDIADEESVSVAGSEYENAPKIKQNEISKPNVKPDVNNIGVKSASSSDETGTRPKSRNTSHAPHPFTVPSSGNKEKDNAVRDKHQDDTKFGPNKRNPSPKAAKPEGQAKSSSIKSTSEVKTDTKKILSKTTETTKTTTEKRSQTVRFNLADDDDDDETEGSKNSLDRAKGKKQKFENGRMR